MSRLDPRKSVRWIRWGVLGVALVGVLWLRGNFLLVRPDGIRGGVWDLSGDRMFVVKRLGAGELPALRSVLLFADRSSRRVARVIGLPGEDLRVEAGMLWVAERATGLDVGELARHEVPAGSVLVAADDPVDRKTGGASLVPLEAVEGAVVVELPF